MREQARLAPSTSQNNIDIKTIPKKLFFKAQYVTINLFNSFVKEDNKGNLDVAGIISKECFGKWQSSRKELPKHPPNAFRKAVTGHVRGDKGLKPFRPAVEKKLLNLLRERKVWPCFEQTKYKIGERGCKTTGYWESHKQDTSFTKFTLPWFLESSRVPIFIKSKLASNEPDKKLKSRKSYIQKLYDLVEKTKGTLTVEEYEEHIKHKKRRIELVDCILLS